MSANPSDWTFVEEGNLGVGYLYLGPRFKVARTIAVTDSINVDVAEDGSIVGVELLNLRRSDS